jgi:preprotein translocase subunit SecB
MKETQNTGIYFLGIELIDLEYTTNPQFTGELTMPELKINYDYKIEEPTETESKRILFSIMSFSLFKKAENWPFRMTFTLQAVYKADVNSPFPLETFSELQAPANMLPYARELISNITSRGIFPTLNLPPVNLQATLTKKKKRGVKKNSG